MYFSLVENVELISNVFDLRENKSNEISLYILLMFFQTNFVYVIKYNSQLYLLKLQTRSSKKNQCIQFRWRSQNNLHSLPHSNNHKPNSNQIHKYQRFGYELHYSSIPRSDDMGTLSYR